MKFGLEVSSRRLCHETPATPKRSVTASCAHLEVMPNPDGLSVVGDTKVSLQGQLSVHLGAASGTSCLRWERPPRSVRSTLMRYLPLPPTAGQYSVLVRPMPQNTEQFSQLVHICKRGQHPNASSIHTTLATAEAALEW